MYQGLGVRGCTVCWTVVFTRSFHQCNTPHTFPFRATRGTASTSTSPPDCTQSPDSNLFPYQPITHANCSGNGQLYNGLIAPLVNTTIAGVLWYQGENSLCYDAGNYAEGTGYGCMMPKLVESWREVWSVEPGTSSPTFPFGIVSLADATDEGFGRNMRGFRWAQTANFGSLPNPAMPNTFGADAYDLGDPWHTPLCGTDGTFAGAPFKGLRCCVDGAVGPLCGGGADGLAVWNLNNTRDWAGLGPLHPRVKKPVGDRLAAGLHAQLYNGTAIASGPVFVGCTVGGAAGGKNGNHTGAGGDGGGGTLELTFNATLLRGESVRFNPANTVAKEDTALYVLVNDTVDFEDPAFAATIVSNHHPRDTDINAFRYTGPYSTGNEMGVTGWVAVAAVLGSTPNTLLVDLSQLPAGSIVRAIRYGAGSGGYNATNGDYNDRSLGSSRICCGPSVDPALEPCPPANCPIKASGDAALPAVPFFAAVTQAGKCKCFKPQVCDA